MMLFQNAFIFLGSLWFIDKAILKYNQLIFSRLKRRRTLQWTVVHPLSLVHQQLLTSQLGSSWLCSLLEIYPRSIEIVFPIYTIIVAIISSQQKANGHVVQLTSLLLVVTCDLWPTTRLLSISAKTHLVCLQRLCSFVHHLYHHHNHLCLFLGLTKTHLVLLFIILTIILIIVIIIIIIINVFSSFG